MCMQKRHGGFFYGLGKRGAAAGNTFLPLAIRGENGGDACTAYSRRGRINGLYKGRQMLRVRVAKDRFREKGIPWAFW